MVILGRRGLFMQVPNKIKKENLFVHFLDNSTRSRDIMNEFEGIGDDNEFFYKRIRN